MLKDAASGKSVRGRKVLQELILDGEVGGLRTVDQNVWIEKTRNIRISICIADCILENVTLNIKSEIKKMKNRQRTTQPNTLVNSVRKC